MSQSRKAVRSVFVIIILGIGSKGLGFLREVLIAARFGSDHQTDAFFLALSAITLLTAILMQALSVTTVPVLSEIELTEGSENKKRHTSNLLTICSVISLAFIVIGWLLAPFAMRLIAYGFDGEQFILAVTLMRIGLPVVIFASITGVLRGYLQSEQKYSEGAVSTYPFNLVYLGYLLFFTEAFGIIGLMVSSVLAVASKLFIQVPAMKSTGFKYSLHIDLGDTYVRKIAWLVPPILASVAVNDLNKIVDRSLASTLADGSVSALTYSGRFITLILGVFISAVVTVVFPMLAKKVAQKEYENFKRYVGQGLNAILLVSIPMTVVMVTLAQPLVRIAFERGAFDAQATSMTAGALVFYSIGLTSMALRDFLYRVYYSLQDTKTPMINAYLSVTVNIILNFAFIRALGHLGLALASSVSATVLTTLFLRGLIKKLGSFDMIAVFSTGLRSCFASLIMGTVVVWLYNLFQRCLGGHTFAELISVLVACIIGGLVYLVLLYLLKVDEVRKVANYLRLSRQE